MFFLKQHNYEDVLGMTGLIAIRSYRKLFDGAFTVNSTETNIYKDRNGIPQKELILTLQNQYPIPQRVSCQTDAFYLICDGMQSKLRIHLFEGHIEVFLRSPGRLLLSSGRRYGNPQKCRHLCRQRFP